MSNTATARGLVYTAIWITATKSEKLTTMRAIAGSLSQDFTHRAISV